MFLTASAKGRSAPPSCLIAVIVVSWLDVYPTVMLRHIFTSGTCDFYRSCSCMMQHDTTWPQHKNALDRQRKQPFHLFSPENNMDCKICTHLKACLKFKSTLIRTPHLFPTLYKTCYLLLVIDGVSQLAQLAMQLVVQTGDQGSTVFYTANTNALDLNGLGLAGYHANISMYPCK